MQSVAEDEPLISDGDLAALAQCGQHYDSVRPSHARRTSSGGTLVSSLDFERIVNQYSIQAVRDQWLLPPLSEDGSAVGSGREGENGEISRSRRKSSVRGYRPKPKGKHLLGYTGRTATRWFLSALAGLLTGLISIVIVQVSGFLVGWRSQNVQSLILDPAYSDAYVFTIYMSLNLAGALLASWLCVGWVPQATGSGISAVKAYLNGIRGNQKFTRLPLFIVKVVGNILAVSSSLAIGQEGPLIHIGAMVGSSLSKISGILSKFLQSVQRWNPECCRSALMRAHINGPSLIQKALTWTTTELSHFATDAERRDLVSIGASVGFAASFGAPVGGLLFILDDISCYFSRNLLLRILVANAIGTLCLAFQHGDLGNYSVINLGHSGPLVTNAIEEIPLYIFIGVMGGILGGTFVASFLWLRRNITSRFPPRGKGRAKYQLLEVAIVSVVTSLLLFYLPSFAWACKSNPDGSTTSLRDIANANGEFDATARHRFFCPEGEINELANFHFGSRIEAIKRILTDPSQFMTQTLLSVGILFYVLMTITFGIAIPSGIFTPTVLIGASLGGAAGNFFQETIDPEITPSTFALLGVAALLAGIQRSTISVAVILVEGTGQIKVLTPAIIVVVIARYVASLITKDGVFEAVMVLKKVPYLEQNVNKRRYDAIEVGDIMWEGPVVSVSPREQVHRLVTLLATSGHNGFPVIDPQTKKFLGLVRRDQIAALIECGVFDKSFVGGVEETPAWARPQTGVDKSPLMRWAYHINDDRYDYIRRQTPVQKERKKAPPKRAIKASPRFSLISSRNLKLAVFSALPTEFASVAQNDEGLVYISWLNSDYAKHWVNIGAVMNRGVYVVTEFCPVSKAYQLFTSLGLRYLVVLGGETGGEVVGVLSRANLLPEYIKERTGV
ncbi:Putative chloride channel-like protein CLC-g [Seminavis robusta]|uniref:Chloride channel protein n=1 Tax=Seminavis robusta TaxID=568900 RepID=A0A9N8EE06_9STRA|nr:Putative chloride channel-like protein CLC-g [Seminavis robusta]|eukprot:Sro804_g204950.1 Putative chloride channel-like protein CLC-g (901) ;mRNA; r:43811-46966